MLETIAGPEDLTNLDSTALTRLAKEIRAQLVQIVATTGGHLGPNLGVVELTLALHKVFDSPRDLFIWDTGHQSYVHKMLTGRRELEGLRQKGGVAGYPQRSESEHDIVESSHASSSLAWAVGISNGFAIQNVDRWVIAIVGDGALTGGMAWEALNNLSEGSDKRLLVVINDNGRSYAPTKGAVKRILNTEPNAQGTSTDRTRGFFETMGIAYEGPTDGHNVAELVEVFAKVKSQTGPVIVHVKTQKGKGYPPALQDQADQFHAVGKIDPLTGKALSGGGGTWTDVFGQKIEELAEKDPRIVAVTASMLIPVGLEGFAKRFPERVFDVGIAEQFAATSAAGLAHTGLHPVVAIYSTFLNRAYDQLLMDVALHKESVTFVLDRSGVTGPDGASHHGVWDIPMVLSIPGLRLAAPRDGNLLRKVLGQSVKIQGPSVIRFPKGKAPAEIPSIRKIGQSEIVAENGSDALLVAVGSLVETAIAAARLLKDSGLDVTVIDPVWLDPDDEPLIEFASSFRSIFTLEDGLSEGGYGSRLGLNLRSEGFGSKVTNLGIPSEFLEHAERDEILDRIGLNPRGICRAVLSAN